VSNWQRIRDEFPITQSRAYFFAGGLAPLSRAARAAINSYAQAWEANPTAAYRARPEADAACLRTAIGGLIGCPADDVAIVDSTSRGNNLAAAMIGAPKGSNVVVDATTYPTALYPWHARGVEVRVAEGESADAIGALVDERTVAVTVSHVSPWSGFRHDLRALSRIAHEVDAALVVDAAQSAGVVALDVEADGVDFLSFGAMKWLLGAPGVAFFYVRPERQECVPPPHLPSHAHVEDGAVVAGRGGRRHELSSTAWPALGACLAGLGLLGSVGGAAVERRVAELAGLVISGLWERGLRVRTPADPARRAGVVAFEARDAGRLVDALRARDVDVWGWDARGLVRVDPHIYNDDSDVCRFLAALDKLV
jgi:cysteine desulfurase / selenocysteine lyase